jgi:LacI family transcriptional regulator
MVLNGVEAALSKKGFFYLTASHLHRDDLLEHHPKMLLERQVEGIIAVDTPIRFKTTLPVVSVSGHDEIKGVTNVVLNHRHAAELSVGHLFTLGHRKIAFIKGQDFSSDTKVRWETIVEAAQRRGIKTDPALTAQLEGDIPSPEIGYIAAQKILSAKKPFTALFAFNDISAIGAIRALQEAGLRVPEDVSVLGFDDIYAAAFHNPALTTIRQPLFEMGSLAAQTLLKRLAKGPENGKEVPEMLTVEPKLIVRQSTASIKKQTSSRSKIKTG